MGETHCPPSMCSLAVQAAAFLLFFFFSVPAAFMGLVFTAGSRSLAGARLRYPTVCRSVRTDVALWINHDPSHSFILSLTPPYLLPTSFWLTLCSHSGTLKGEKMCVYHYSLIFHLIYFFTCLSSFEKLKTKIPLEQGVNRIANVACRVNCCSDERSLN